MADKRGVEALCLLLSRRKRHGAGGEADAGADRGEVVQVVVEPFQLEQQGARTGERRRRR